MTNDRCRSCIVEQNKLQAEKSIHLSMSNKSNNKVYYYSSSLIDLSKECLFE